MPKKSTRKVVPLLSKVERDRNKNQVLFIEKAKLLSPSGLEKVQWEDDEWIADHGRLTKDSSKKSGEVKIGFCFSPKLGGEPLPEVWSAIAKAMMVVRYHRANQSLSNQRQFVRSLGYVAKAATESRLSLEKITEGVLDSACRLISEHYKPSTAYNMHKAVAEFSAICDANGLCAKKFNYRYRKMRRPESSGGMSGMRLDDPKLNDYVSDKLVPEDVMRSVGELYQTVPSEHKYRHYILMLSLFAILGRRFSEIALLPNQEVGLSADGYSFLFYFPRKSSKGNRLTPKEKVFIPTSAVDLVNEIVSEAATISSGPRKVATYMQGACEPDFSFLAGYKEEDRLYKDDLNELGVNPQLLSGYAWLGKRGYTYPDRDKLNSKGVKSANPPRYTLVRYLKEYCRSQYEHRILEPIHTDETGKKYYFHDLMFVRYQGLSSGAYAHWLATYVSHAMFKRFVDSGMSELVEEYCQAESLSKFTSHQFRHTLNTLVDEGGLSDALQTEWFGRKNPVDTKAYQHTSREQKVLSIHQKLKEGGVGGIISKEIQKVPIDQQDAFIKARVKGVHDVGVGICIHSFSQNSCERHLQCSASCRDFAWLKDDAERIDEVKRQYAMTLVSQNAAFEAAKSGKGKYSSDWVEHNRKKLITLKEELDDLGIEDFDHISYLEGVK
ncbi:hypothetical protein QLQ86_17175 [Halomonas sp. LR5S13]|uniref:hypothetical protein n=1 Tax=Halomonas rhizosphaerae TaxID=3043296 RepID=UPI0024A82B58|nr:hypothetical protein [Halomonas rhizosphaerae]MDI5922516.1 hypothetical protein [Halomonas rhizosphaerae]